MIARDDISEVICGCGVIVILQSHGLNVLVGRDVLANKVDVQSDEVGEKAEWNE